MGCEHNEGKKKGSQKMALQIVTHGHEKRIRCEICGREFMQEYNEDYYCSQTCKEKAEQRRREKFLREMKEKGGKVLAKWEKALEKDVKKRKARIEKLDSALQGNDPDAIVKAIKGSFFTRVFYFIYRFLKIITFTIGIICILRGALWFYNGISNVNSNNGEHIERATETANESSQQTETTEASQPVVSNAVPVEVVAPSADEGKASDMK